MFSALFVSTDKVYDFSGKLYISGKIFCDAASVLSEILFCHESHLLIFVSLQLF